MTEEEYIDWEVPECENCVRAAHKWIYVSIHELPEKWVCVGNIPKPKDSNDTHDLVNKVRICIRKNETETDQFEWTPYEASIVSSFLGLAISNELYDKQPYLDDDNKLVIEELTTK